MAAKKEKKVSIIPLGGYGEIGKNMTVVEYGGEMVVIDAGLAFPDEEMLGIDLVIPDFTYLLENRDKVRAVLLTHGHEDHIGALPYLLKELDVPIYGTRLTLALAQAKFEEYSVKPKQQMQEVSAGDSVEIGPFKVDFIRVSHSIADVVALAIHTPAGIIVHTGDFKLDQTPIDGKVTDFRKFAELGDQGVLVLLSDSTNAERPGYTMSERAVGQTLDDAISEAQGRVLVATFASNIHRIQQIIDASHKHGRKVAIMGRSMEKVASIALDLGYLKAPRGVLIEVDDIDKLAPRQITIITTGSQGEPMSALSRIAMGAHRKISIIPGDTVIISAMPIPGNERSVGRNINHLFKLGAEVIYERVSGIHVSGHASQEELRMMLNLVRPRYFIPTHGEHRHLVKHARLAEEVGIPRERIFLPEIGDRLEFSAKSGAITGKVTAGTVLVDGLGVGDVGNIVLRDRKQLAQDGILIVVVTIDRQTGVVAAGPDIVSRGFVYVRESEALLEEAKSNVKQALDKCSKEQITEWSYVKNYIKETLNTFLYDRTRRRPMILPIIMEV